MNYQQKILANLTGSPSDRERKAAILENLITAFETGSETEAVMLLSDVMTDFETRFDAKLQELREKF